MATHTAAEAAVVAMHGAWPTDHLLGVTSASRRAALGTTGVGVVDGTTTIVADARLDNRDELRRILSTLDRSSDDTAIVLAAWRRWGDRCCEHLVGDFAFAVWDEETGRLFCGRDVVGAKPLYYWVAPGGGLAFASQLGGLLAHPDLERRLDTAAAVDHLLYLHHDTRRTLFEHVHRLGPGQALSWDRAGPPQTWQHSELRPAPVAFARLDDWVEGLRSALRQAVADRLHASDRMGAHLSGGLDSSAVVALAASELGERRKALLAVSFSAPPGILLEGQAPVDADFIRAVADHSGVEVHHPDVDVVPFPDALGRAAPGMMPPPYATSSAHRWAAELGIDTMLSGWGGDEGSSFNGRSHLADALRRGRVNEVARALRQLRRPRGPRGTPKFVWEYVATPLLPDRMFWWAGRRRGDPTIDRIPASTVDERMAQDIGAAEHVRHPVRTRPTTRATQLGLLHSGHLVARIEAWSADAARFGIDYRHPLLDRRVLELALAAPSEAFLHDGVQRWLFRAATAPYLPSSVAWRTNKKDSWTQRRDALDRGGAGPGSAAWVVAEASRMIAEGNDLGGVVDLAKLRRTISGPRNRFSGSALVAQSPLIGAMLTTQLAAFVEHNRISAG